MTLREDIEKAFGAAFPIMLGYVAIGLPCGILCSSIGLGPLQVFLLSALFYSGAGQFMIPNMWLAASPVTAIIASVAFVNTRQMLYSASFAPFCQRERKRLSFFFAATVTDESYGVNMAHFQLGEWTVRRALLVNLLSQSSWTVSNVVGALIGNAISVPLAIASFAMTSIFICLLCSQKMSPANVVAVVVSMVGVVACKAMGLSGPAILVGAVLGVVAAFAFARIARRSRSAGAAKAAPSADGGQASNGTGDGAGTVANGRVCAAEPDGEERAS